MSESYIGPAPKSGFISTAVQRVTGSTNNYVDLDHSISSLSECIVWWNNVKQDTNDLTLTTSTRITLGGTLVSGDVVQILFVAKAVSTQAPATGSVTNDMLATPTTINNNADNKVITGSGTANTLEGEANLTFDGGTLTVKDDANGSTTETLVVTNGTSANPSYSNLVFKTGGNTSGCWIKGVQASGGNDGRLEFHTNNSGTVGEAMRINYQGIVSIGTTETAYSNLTQAGDNGIILTDTSASIIATDQSNPLVLARTNADNNNRDILNFNRNGSTCGQITGTNSATTYATSSDYRLKENVNYDFDATTRLKQLKPARFNFIIDETNTLRDGFIAHEVSNVVPRAVVGEKDAVDSEGNIEPQTIDQSKLVPLLVKTVQELEARIKTLEDA